MLTEQNCTSRNASQSAEMLGCRPRIQSTPGSQMSSPLPPWGAQVEMREPHVERVSQHGLASQVPPQQLLPRAGHVRMKMKASCCTCLGRGDVWGHRVE